jgi:hypothetical protein
MEDMVWREMGAKVKVDEHYPQEPKEEEDGGGCNSWSVSERRYNRNGD